MRGLQLPYTDSSPVAPGVLEAICLEIGYSVRGVYNTPFRVGCNEVGDRLGALDGQLYVFVKTAVEPFRVGLGEVGDRLVSTEKDLWQLLCFLRKVAPARYEVVVLYEI